MSAFRVIPFHEPEPRPHFHQHFNFVMGGVTEAESTAQFTRLLEMENISYIAVGTDSPPTAQFKNYVGAMVLRRQCRLNTLNNRHEEILFRVVLPGMFHRSVEEVLRTADHIEFGSIPIEY